jgi:hypothetical protein
MPDWGKICRERLAHLGLSPEREAEIVEELAKDLEQSWLEAVAAGVDEQQATAAALKELGDDGQLEREIMRALRASLPGRISRACAGAERNLPLGSLSSGAG